MSELVRSPETLIGQPAKELVRALVAGNPQIKEFYLVRYNPEARSQEADPDLFWHYDRDFNERTGADFDWVLDPERQRSLDPTEIGIISKIELVREKKPDVYMDLGHDYAHVPMIHFSIPGKPPTWAVQEIKSFLTMLGDFPGWVVDAGRGSYQFYGNGLMSMAEFSEFLGNLRFNAEHDGIVNLGFIRRAFEPNFFSEDCYTTLRLLPSRRRPNIPTVIDVV